MKDLVVRSVVNDEELRQANELMAKTQGESCTGAQAWLTSFGEEYPGFRREHTRIALYCGHVVAALRLTTDTIRIGEARLKMGGLGWVSTDKAWRRRGIVGRVVTDTMHYMQEQKYHVCMLFGVREFYRRWGFAPTLVENTVSMNTPRLVRVALEVPYRVRSVKPGDIQAMQKMHSLHEAELSCSVLRTQAHLANKWRLWESVRVLTDAQGKVTAYFRGSKGDSGFIIDEVGAADSEGCARVVDVATQFARQAGLTRLCFNVPPNHPLALHVQEKHARRGLKVAQCSSGMMALANVGEALESMIPEWESRLVEGGHAPAHAELTLLVGRAGWRVRAHHGAMDVSAGTGANKVAFSAQELVQLVVGSLELDEVLASKRRIVSTEGLAVLRAMFPRRLPYVWTVDRF